MTPERLRQVANVLDVVLELDESMRSSYLGALGAEDTELQRAVETHLRQLTGQDEPPSSAPSESLGHEVGSCIGPYRIIEHVGVGGMGTVYLAEREDEQFERRVAVKVLRAGFDSPELIRRFVAERQILARLEHANIARLYGGGTTADGRPYLAMEYVDGRPIDRYCDEEKLGIVERLAVMCKVCRAVQYAHRHLIVHRDLKPSNIMVDAAGEPRLLDFGVAKLLDPESFPMTIEATRTGLSPMTPHYASPEQVSGEAITTATDVYALGVLLYRLLAGRLPYHFQSGARDHILRTLEKSGPTRPSQVMLERTTARSAEATSQDASAPRAEPEPLPALLGLAPTELQRQISGDLDSITLKALRPEPEHRYSSPEELAVDLERHLSGLPVTARQGTWRYRVGKFLRRHKLATSLAAASISILAVLAVFMTWQAARIAEERNAAIEARDAAQTAQRAEEEVVEFLTGLFKNADPRQSRGKDMTARELLERGAEEIRGELADSPAVQSRLLSTMSDVYHELSLYQDSVDLAEESIVLGEAHGVSKQEIGKARLRKANGLIMLGKLDEATAVLDRIEASLGADAAEPRLAGSRGLISFNLGKFDEAAQHFSTAISGYAESESPDYSAMARAYSNLAFAEEQLSKPEAAEGHYLESLRLARQHLGEDHPMVGTSLNNLGACLKDQGRIEEAEEYYRQAHEIRVRVLGEDHLQTAQTRANLAILDADAGQWREAVKAFKSTIQAFEKHLGPKHPHVGMAWNNLGQCYRQLGEHELAKDALSQGFDAVSASVGPEHPIAAQNLLQQAALALDLFDIASADGHFSRIETIIDGSVGRSHRIFFSLEAGRCRAEALKGSKQSVEVCEQALSSNHEAFGKVHRSSLGIYSLLIEASRANGDLQGALDHLAAAEAVAEATTSADHPGRIALLNARGDLHRDRDEVDEAATAFRRALEIAEIVGITASHPARRHAREMLAKISGS